MHLLLAAEDMSAYDHQKRELFSDNANLKIPKEHTAVFYESPLLVKLLEDYLLAEAQSFIFSLFQLLFPFL